MHYQLINTLTAIASMDEIKSGTQLAIHVHIHAETSRVPVVNHIQFLLLCKLKLEYNYFLNNFYDYFY